MSRRNSLEPLTLIVEPDNICNTNIFDSDDGRILYQVMTPAKPSSNGEYITTLYNVYGDTIATLVWRTDSSKRDYIVIGSNPTMLVQSWLRKSSVPFKDREYVSFRSSIVNGAILADKETLHSVISFQDPAGRQYKWKGNAPGLPLEVTPLLFHLQLSNPLTLNFIQHSFSTQTGNSL